MTATNPDTTRHGPVDAGPTVAHDGTAGVATTAAPHRAAGLTAIAGAATMIAGAIAWSIADADLWGLVDGDVQAGTYLADAAASAPTLHAAHTIWMAGVFVLALGGALLTGRRDDPASGAARASYTIGAALAIPAFMSMVALTRLAESGADQPALAAALAFLGARLDDVATVILLGVGPVLLGLANRRTWMPSWLVALAWVCGAAGLLSLVSLFFGMAASLGFLIVPVGMIWTIAAGTVAVRSPRHPASI
jgi:hypothetical protein